MFAKAASIITARNVLLFSLVAEGTTGLAVILAPGLVAQLLFGADVAGVGVAYGRLLGMTLLALVIACWPHGDAVQRPALHAVLAYNLLAAIYLVWLGVAHRPAGILLWPAVAEHALVALLLAARMRAARPATAVQKLKELKSLLDRGVITQSQYNADSQKLLNERVQ